MSDDIFPNIRFLESLSKRIEEQRKFIQPLMDQVDFSAIARATERIANSSMCEALTTGTSFANDAFGFDSGLTQLLQNLSDSQAQMLGNIVSMETMMGTRFQELIQPSVYLPDLSGLHEVLESCTPVISEVVPKIDTSWMQMVSTWQIELPKISSFDTSVLCGMETKFAELVKLEKKTSSLSIVESYFSKITSVTAQWASISEAASCAAEQWKNTFSHMHLMDNYSDFALKQHRLIQKAANLGDERSVEWRLDLLQATSKFVDRQIRWSNELALDVQEEVDEETDISVSTELDINAIPQYIGFSKRDDRNTEEAFAESFPVVITEKGKLLVQKAGLIKTLCKISNKEVLFEDTDSLVGSYMTLGGTFCRNIDSLEAVIAALYRMFFNQRNLIIKYVTSQETGCLSEIEILKDQKDYPDSSKELVKLQNLLYDRFLKLEDLIIDELQRYTAGVYSGHPADAVSTILCEEKWTEESVSKNVFKALLNVQKNKTFYGKKEDEWNDEVRNSLGMVYDDIRDQTRQGTSVNGKEAGEVDIQICREGLPFVMIEGLKVDSVNRSYIREHIDKVLTNYDPCGCPQVYVILYAAVTKFDEFWERLFAYLKEEYEFPFKVKDELWEMNHIYCDSRHGKTVLLRENKEVAVHFYAMCMQ